MSRKSWLAQIALLREVRGHHRVAAVAAAAAAAVQTPTLMPTQPWETAVVVAVVAPLLHPHHAWEHGEEKGVVVTGLLQSWQGGQPHIAG